MAVASSLGLAPASIGDVAPMDTSPESLAPFFICALVDDDAGEALTYRHPMCGGVLSTAGAFDSRTKNVLIVRVSSAGLESSVGEPKKLDPYTVEIPVTRINRPDFVHQLLPNKDEAARARRVAETNKQIRATFGRHFDYDVLNRAFQAMVPESEQWTIQATVNAPYMFGNMKETFMFRAPNAVDVLALFPLELEERKSEKAQIVNIDDDIPIASRSGD